MFAVVSIVDSETWVDSFVDKTRYTNDLSALFAVFCHLLGNCCFVTHVKCMIFLQHFVHFYYVMHEQHTCIALRCAIMAQDHIPVLQADLLLKWLSENCWYLACELFPASVFGEFKYPNIMVISSGTMSQTLNVANFSTFLPCTSTVTNVVNLVITLKCWD